MNDNDNKIPVIKTNANYWIVRAGVKARYFEEFSLNSYIAIGWDRISNIKEIQNYSKIEVLKEKVEEKYPEFNEENKGGKGSKRKITDISNKVYNFINQLKIGDLVLTPGKNEVLIGEVTSDPYLIPDSFRKPSETEKEELIGGLNKARRVKWIKRIPKEQLEPNLRLAFGVYHGIANLKNTQVITEINRSLYNFYIKENRSHLIYQVNTQEEIDFEKYSYFINNMQKLFNILKENKNDKLYIKTNVQSPGPIELIGDSQIAVLLSLGAKFLFKKDTSALTQIKDTQKRKEIKKLSEEIENDYDYEDYDFPSHSQY